MTVHPCSHFIERFVDSVTTRPLLNDLVRMRTDRRIWASRSRERDLDKVADWGEDRDAAA